MSKNTEVRSNRDRYAERVKAKYPDREFSDDESLFSQINDDYDNYDNELSAYKEREASLSGLFAANPRSAAFLMDWRNGEDPIAGLVRKFGDDFKEALEDPEKIEVLAAANKEYADRVAEADEYEEAYQKNASDTLLAIESLQQEQNIADDDIDKAMNLLLLIVRDGILGKFTPDSIMMAVKAIKYDSDIEQADLEGETRGRNSKIEEKLRKGNKSDGTANLSGKNGGGAVSKRMPDLGALERYGDDSENIFKRGGFKRIKR